VASFNSTVPTGKKNIRKIISSERGKISLQMQNAGDDIYSLEPVMNLGRNMLDFGYGQKRIPE
jgi:hypothetical protein